MALGRPLARLRRGHSFFGDCFTALCLLIWRRLRRRRRAPSKSGAKCQLGASPCWSCLSAGSCFARSIGICWRACWARSGTGNGRRYYAAIASAILSLVPPRCCCWNGSSNRAGTISCSSGPVWVRYPLFAALGSCDDRSLRARQRNLHLFSVLGPCFSKRTIQAICKVATDRCTSACRQSSSFRSPHWLLSILGIAHYVISRATIQWSRGIETYIVLGTGADVRSGCPQPISPSSATRSCLCWDSRPDLMHAFPGSDVEVVLHHRLCRPGWSTPPCSTR